MKIKLLKLIALPILSLYSTTMFALSAPSNLYLTNITGESITLNWTYAVSEQTGFKVYRNGTIIHITGPNTTTYTDNGLHSGTDYTYTVKAIDLFDELVQTWITSGTYRPTKMLYANFDNPTLYIDNSRYYYKTSDAGATWQSSSNSEIQALPYNLTMDTLKLISTDEQIPVENGYPVAVEDIIADGEGNYYVASYNFNVYKVLADGNWIKLTIDDDWNNQTFHSSPCALLYENGILYVGTYWEGLYKYQNNEWSHMSNGLPAQRGINGIQKTSDGTLYTVVHDQIGGNGIYKYDSNANKWNSINYGLSNYVIHNTWHIEINSEDDIFINVPHYGIYKKNKNFNNWLNISPYQGKLILSEVNKIITIADGSIFALCGGHRGAGAGPGGIGIFKSNDYGKTWQEYGQNIKTRGMSIMDMTIDSNNTLFACDYDKPIYKRLASSGKWKKVFHNDTAYSSPGIMASDLSNNNIYYGTYYNGVYENKSGTTAFKAINNGLPESASVKRLVASNGVLYAIINNEIWTTNSSNINWNILPSLSGYQFELFIIDNILYVGTNNGVYKYDNGNWIAFNDGLPSELSVFAFAYKNNTIYIGTANGIYFKVAENPWQHIDNNGLNDNRILSIAVSEDGYIYAGTDNGFNRYKLQNQ